MINNDDYAILAERLGFPGSARLCAIFQILMTPEQAKIVAALPGSVAEVAAKTGLPEEEARKEFDALYYKGVIFPRAGFETRDYYRFARHIIQLHDATLADPHLDPQKDYEYFRLWHEFCIQEGYPRMAGLFKNAATRITRVIPYHNAVKDLPGVLPVEDFHAILRAQELIAVVPCSCRTRTSVVGEQCKSTAEAEKWHCLQFGRGAEYVLSRGTGRKLTAEQAIQLSDAIEKDGLIHRWANNANMSGVNTSCQCCRDCCEEWVAMEQSGVPVSVWWEKSRYQACIPEADVCNGCRECVEACQFDAIKIVDSEVGGGLRAVIDPESCFGCGACVVRCEPKAIKMKAVRPPEFIPSAGAQA